MWVFENLPLCTTMVITKNIDNLISAQIFFDIEDLIGIQFLKQKTYLTVMNLVWTWDLGLSSTEHIKTISSLHVMHLDLHWKVQIDVLFEAKVIKVLKNSLTTSLDYGISNLLIGSKW